MPFPQSEGSSSLSVAPDVLEDAGLSPAPVLSLVVVIVDDVEPLVEAIVLLPSEPLGVAVVVLVELLSVAEVTGTPG